MRVFEGFKGKYLNSSFLLLISHFQWFTDFQHDIYTVFTSFHLSKLYAILLLYMHICLVFTSYIYFIHNIIRVYIYIYIYIYRIRFIAISGKIISTLLHNAAHFIFLLDVYVFIYDITYYLRRPLKLHKFCNSIGSNII